MTTEDRFERVEHVVAGHIAQARLDYEENRRLWREWREDAAARDRIFDERMEAMRQEMAERDRLADLRAQDLDKGISDLVSAIGVLIAQLPER